MFDPLTEKFDQSTVKDTIIPNAATITYFKGHPDIELVVAGGYSGLKGLDLVFSIERDIDSMGIGLI